MRAATLWPLCCLKVNQIEDNQRWCRGRRTRESPGSRCFQSQWISGKGLIPEARILVRCNVASSPESLESIQDFTTSESSFCIRAAELGDLWQVADTHCSTFMPDQGLLMDFALRFDRMLVLLGTLAMMDHKKFLVAHGGSDDEVSGILTIDKVGEFLPRTRPSGSRRTGIAYVSNVAVRHQRRRKGVGRKLLRESEEVARSWGCRSIALHCDESNGGAVALYKAEGYRVVTIPRDAKWPQPKGLAGSRFLFMMKLLQVSS